jgi:hypothetical protein
MRPEVARPCTGRDRRGPVRWWGLVVLGRMRLFPRGSGRGGSGAVRAGSSAQTRCGRLQRRPGAAHRRAAGPPPAGSPRPAGAGRASPVNLAHPPFDARPPRPAGHRDLCLPGPSPASSAFRRCCGSRPALTPSVPATDGGGLGNTRNGRPAGACTVVLGDRCRAPETRLLPTASASVCHAPRTWLPGSLLLPLIDLITPGARSCLLGTDLAVAQE